MGDVATTTGAGAVPSANGSHPELKTEGVGNDKLDILIVDVDSPDSRLANLYNGNFYEYGNMCYNLFL